MLTRRLLPVLLALATLAAAARPCAAVAQGMTDAEAREARALTLRFMERLRETDDFGPLVKEFLPADFERRLMRFVAEPPRREEEDFLICFDRAALSRAEPSELRRSYVALMNFWSLQDRIGSAARAHNRLRCEAAGEEPCGWGGYPRLVRGAVPEEALRIAATDPLLEVMLAAVGDDGEHDPGEEEADEARARAAVISDPARLRAFNDKLERCVALLRESLAKLTADAKSYAAAHSLTRSFEDMLAARDELKVYHLSEDTFEEPFFGMPAGALLIRARVYPFEMAIARVDGRLQILSVYPDFDGD